MKVLLTGSFGNIGESTLIALCERGDEVRCFDLKSSMALKKQEQLSKSHRFETVWGSITNPDELKSIVDGVDAIIHLAAILAPTSEGIPDLARKVNVGGARNLLDAATKIGTNPRFIFPSSVSVHGPRKPQESPLTANSPLVPTDNYTHHKVEGEQMVRESGLPWVITRITAVPSLRLSMNFSFFPFEIPLKQKIEFGHTRDIGEALANSINAPVVRKVLMLGGGRSCQMINEEFVNRFTRALGLGRFPTNAFREPKNDNEWYYTDWLDTTDSEKFLHYQSHTFEDYLLEMRQNFGSLRYLTQLFAPLLRHRILAMSPYYKR